MVRIGILHDMTQADDGAGSRRTVQVAIDEIAASPAGVSLPEIELVTEIAEGHPRGTPESVAAALRARSATRT